LPLVLTTSEAFSIYLIYKAKAVIESSRLPLYCRDEANI
jgi:hypothetical protein